MQVYTYLSLRWALYYAVLGYTLLIYVYNLAWGGLKKGKNGGDPYGFYPVFALVGGIIFLLYL